MVIKIHPIQERLALSKRMVPSKIHTRSNIPSRLVSDPYHQELKPDKGLFKGSCNRTACQAAGAQFYNHGTYKYYCADCAILLNDTCIRNTWMTKLLCELELAPGDENDDSDRMEMNRYAEERNKRRWEASRNSDGTLREQKVSINV